MYQNNIYSFSFFHSINTTLGSRLVEIAISIAGHLFRRDDYSFNSTTLLLVEIKDGKYYRLIVLCFSAAMTVLLESTSSPLRSRTFRI